MKSERFRNPPAPGAKRDQITGVAFMRFLMALLVISLHTIPMALPDRAEFHTPAAALFLGAVGRMAVPFFLVASGFFMARGAWGMRRVLSQSGRLLAIQYAATAAYFIALWLWPVRAVSWSLQSVVLGDAIYPLWFLPALAAAMPLVALGRTHIGEWPTALLVLLLAFVGPILRAYHGLFGIEEYHWRLVPLSRHLAAPLLVYSGTLIFRLNRPMSPIVPALVVCAMIVALLAEMVFSSRVNGYSWIIQFDFLVTTFTLGPLIFLVALNWRVSPRLAALGRYGLTIYLVHIYFVWVAKALFPIAEPCHTILVIAFAAVCAAAVAVCWVPSQARIRRAMGSRFSGGLR